MATTLGRSRLGGLLAGLALFLLIMIAAGVGYEQIARRRERDRFPQVGRSVDVGGRTLNIFCSGEGSPTVVLETNALAPGYSWVVLQQEIARMTRACWYDRAGYGWSDPAPAPHPGPVMVKDLYTLLRNAGVKPPYVLVGDGFGGFLVRLYTSTYPIEVEGVVLVDTITAEGEQRGVASRVPFHLGYPSDLVLRTAGELGLIRILLHSRPLGQRPQGWSPSQWATLSGLCQQPKLRAAFLAEEGFTSTLDQLPTRDSIGNRPMVVLAADTASEPSSDPARAAAQQREYEASQSRLAHLSTHGSLVLVKDRPGGLQYEAPDAVLRAVQDVVTQVRRGP